MNRYEIVYKIVERLFRTGLVFYSKNMWYLPLSDGCDSEKLWSIESLRLSSSSSNSSFDVLEFTGWCCIDATFSGRNSLFDSSNRSSNVDDKTIGVDSAVLEVA